MAQEGNLEKNLREEFGDAINYIKKEGRIWVIALNNGKVVFLSENVVLKDAKEKIRKAITRRGIPPGAIFQVETAVVRKQGGKK